MGRVFAVGVGPGASDHLTEDVKKLFWVRMSSWDTNTL